jgi:hypothetical protein
MKHPVHYDIYLFIMLIIVIGVLLIFFLDNLLQ